ncbi:MAG: cysteine transporter ATP-binding protein [Anaerocolumna sp.]|jgi:ABC-type multidrug transport system fused ATPase/permease subunit|nr:cysteine transporter ATP-binding protein [Anaerocolumna sp.]
MMINKRLINTVEESKKYIVFHVILQWAGLIANAGIVLIISNLISGAYKESLKDKELWLFAIGLILLIGIRFLCTRLAGHFSYLSSKAVKRVLRDRIYEKLLKLGAGYTGKISTASVVQVAVEGVEQLETYFGAYLPQFFYSMIAPVTLFLIISPISLSAGVQESHGASYSLTFILQQPLLKINHELSPEATSNNFTGIGYQDKGIRFCFFYKTS